MRGVRLGFSWLIVMTSGAAGGAQAEVPPVPPTTESRPVILVEHEIHDASPFSTDGTAAPEAPAHSGTVTRLPPVSPPVSSPTSAMHARRTSAESSPPARWEPETRFEPAIRAALPANSHGSVRSEGWKSVAKLEYEALPAANVGSPIAVAMSGAAPGDTLSNTALPIAANGSRTPAVQVMTIPTGGPWPSRTLPSPRYAISGVNPQVPPPREEPSYLSRNLWGESKEFVAGQTVRNAWRFLAP